MSVFISYKSDDRDAVAEIVDGLTRDGFEVWWDQGIAPSAEWRADIVRQLASARAVVVVWSHNSVDREQGTWVIQEAEDADARHVLVPVVIDDVRPPLGMRHRQAADLVDWHGDRQDPRWSAFVATVRRMVEGRPVEARPLADSTPTLATTLRGRASRLSFTAGLAVFLSACVLAFGWLPGAAVLIGLVLFYVSLHLLFSRRHRDRAAATFLRRAFSIGWVTTLGNILIWLAAIATALYPYARDAAYADFSIGIYDELRKPVPDAQVTIMVAGRERRIALSAEGIGRVEYPLFWGPDTGVVRVRHRDYSTERTIERRTDRFADLTLGVPSGVERFRVRHVTLTELAIDAIHQGHTPQEIATLVPSIVGVVRNPVWDITEAFLRTYATLGHSEGTYSGARVGDIEVADQATPTGGASEAQLRNNTLRWPREHHADVSADFSSGIFGCPIAEPLDAHYRLILGLDYERSQSDLLPDDVAIASLKTRGLERVRQDDGFVRGHLLRLVDHQWLAQLLDSRPTLETHSSESEVMAYLRFMVAHSVPSGVIGALLRLKAAAGCGFTSVAVELTMPPAELRVTLIENVSDIPLPVDAVVQGVARRDRMEPWAQGGIDDSIATPWAGGLLNPGAALAIPRRLIIKREMSAQEFAAWRTAAEGPSVSFGLRPDAGETDEELREASLHNARAFTLRAGQVLIDESASSQAAEEPPRPSPATDTYVIGPSVESLAVRIGDLDFDLRDDPGMVLAMMGGFAFGSCPYVFAAPPGGDMSFNRGPILTDRIGARAEGTDRLYLGRATGKVDIRELESEVTQLNRVRLIVRDADGRERTFAAAEPDLGRIDNRYVVLRQGQVLKLEFPGYRPGAHDTAAFLEVTGFYTPLVTPYIDQVALRRKGVGTLIPGRSPTFDPALRKGR